MRSAIMRQLRLFLVVLLGYLCQVCIMPYVQVGGVSPNLLCCMIAIVTVGYGRLRALWVGCFYGIVMETLLPTVTLLNLMYYPISALFCSVFFADKSASRLQYERSMGKAGRNRSPYIRILGCTMVNILIFEIVNVAYMYLGGTALTMTQVGKSLTDILATTALAGLIMYPVRKLLGFKPPREEDPEKQRFGYQPRRV
ncbi:MAG: hypothetical protein IJ438_07355 [Clostridia bacterium]|nr:hypothetical protein [Clostridia bacterium]